MFPRDVAGIVADYASEHKLLPWIDETCINWRWLSINPNAMDMIRDNLEKIDWMSRNPSIFVSIRCPLIWGQLM
jgi:hypothetical protein